MVSSQEFAGAQPNVQGDGDITVKEALKSKSVIDSNVPDVGGFKYSNKILGKTPGERAFNLLDWYGIGYGLNSAISIWAGDQARQGIFWPAFKKTNHWLGNSFLFRQRKDSSHPHKFSQLEAEHLDSFVDEVRKHVSGTADEGILKNIDDRRAKNELGALEREDLKRSIRRTHLNYIFDAINDQGEAAGKHHTPIIEQMLDKHIMEDGRLGRFTSNEVASLRKLSGPAFTQEASRMFKTLAEDTQALKTSRNNARTWTSFFMLSIGGWALMFPIKWLEDYKAPIVKFFDDRYEKKHHLTETQKDALHQRHEELGKEPPQTYGSVLLARFLSYPVIIASYLALGPRIKTMEHDGHDSGNWLAKYVPGFKNYKGTDTLAGHLAGCADKRAQKWGPYNSWENRMHNNALDREARYAQSKQTNPLKKRFSATKGRAEGIIGDTITETVYSLWMVTCTFISSRFTAAFFDKKPEPKKAPGQPPMPAQPPIDTAPAENNALISQNTAAQPTTRVSGGDALSAWMAKTQSAERVSPPPGTEPARA